MRIYGMIYLHGIRQRNEVIFTNRSLNSPILGRHGSKLRRPGYQPDFTLDRCSVLKKTRNESFNLLKQQRYSNFQRGHQVQRSLSILLITHFRKTNEYNLSDKCLMFEKQPKADICSLYSQQHYFQWLQDVNTPGSINT